MAPVRAVVFDLDDTLLDHRGSTTAALAAWLPGLGVEPAPGLEQAWFDLEDEHFESWRSGLISFDEQRRRRLRDFLPLVGQAVGPDAELDLVFVGYLEQYERAWRPFDDVRPAVDDLVDRGIALAVLTNGSTAQQTAKVAAIGLSDCVAGVVTAEQLGVAKPAPQTYRAACRLLSVAPAETVHVGDRHDLDVVAARAAGLRALHLDRHRREEEAPAGRITTLAELSARLET
nr:HAD family hydrolase [Microlunatus antarcticus]